MTAGLAETLAVTIGDAWWRVAEEPRRFATSSAEQQATFRAMAAAALASAKAGRNDAEAIAQALCGGFWQGHPLPRAWDRLGQNQRAAFLAVAEAVIAEGRRLRAARDARSHAA